MERLRQWKLYANISKCTFCTDEVEYLGFFVGRKGVRMDPSRVAAVQDWPEPRTLRELQVFLGFANFYRRFVYRYSLFCMPMTRLLKGSEKGKQVGTFTFDAEAQEGFRKLKETFTQAPMLQHFQPHKKLMMETDASGFAISGTLSQPSDDPTQAHYHPIAFFSRKMTEVESRYDTHDGELLAIVACFQQWRHYLEGAQHTVIVKTDHNNLKYFMTKRALNRRQVRWAEILACYDFEIVYRTGVSNPADGLSRRPDYEPNTEKIESTILPTLSNKMKHVMISRIARFHTPTEEEREGRTKHKGSSSSQEMFPGQWRHPKVELGSTRKNDEILYRVLAATVVESNSSKKRTAPGDDQEESEDSDGENEDSAFPAGTTDCNQLLPRKLAVSVCSTGDAYDEPKEPLVALIQAAQAIDPFFLRREWSSQQDGGLPLPGWMLDSTGVLRKEGKIYVPQQPALKAELLRVVHDEPFAGHFGEAKTYDLLSRNYYWQGMRADVKTYVKECDICQRTRVHRHLPYGELAPLPQPSGPWQEISMDFITGLPPSKWPRESNVYDSIFVIVDRYTKMSIYIPVTKKIDTEELAEAFLRHFVKSYGNPKGIVSDRGSVFTSKFWGAFCRYLKIRRRLSTAFHPQTDGQTERQNQTIEQYLRCYTNWRQNDWVSRLPLAEFSYNNSKHSTTGMSPFRALYGYDPEINAVSEDGAKKGEARDAMDRIKEMQEDRKTLEEHYREAVEHQKKYYDKKHADAPAFQVGDKVMLRAKNVRQQRPNRKLASRYLGPYPILEIMGKGQAFKIELPPAYKIHPVFHVSLLERYHGDNPEVAEPESIEVDGEEEWEIDAILEHKIIKGEMKYYVRWQGYGGQDSWEPEECVEHATELVNEYWEANGPKPTNNPRRSLRQKKRRRTAKA